MDSLAVALCKPCLSIDMVKLCHICLQRSVDEGF
jgi:recombinational DNA repair protein RecR